MNTVAIPNIDVRVWTHKGDFPLGHFLCSLTQPKNTTQGPFEMTGIEYDLINYETPGMECVEYNTSIRINVMNVNDIEAFSKL